MPPKKSTLLDPEEEHYVELFANEPTYGASKKPTEDSNSDEGGQAKAEPSDYADKEPVNDTRQQLAQSEAVAANAANAENASSLSQQESQPESNWGNKLAGRNLPTAGGLTKKIKIRIATAVATAIISTAATLLGGIAGGFVALKEMAFDHFNKNHYSTYSKAAAKIQKRIFEVPEENCTGVKCKLKPGVTDNEIDKYKKAGLNPEIGEKAGKKYVKSFNTVDTKGAALKVTANNFDDTYKNNLKFRGKAWAVGKPKAMVWRSQAALDKFNVFKISRAKLFSKAKEMRKYIFGGGKNSVKTTPTAEDEKDAKSKELISMQGVTDEIASAADAVRADLDANDYENPVISGTPDLADLDTSAANGVNVGTATAKNALNGVAGGAVLGAFNALDKACSGYTLLRAVEIGAKIYRYRALIQFAMIFAVHADALKAGDLTPDQMGLMIGMLMTPSTLAGSKGYTAANSNLFSLVTSGKVSNRAGLAYGVIGTPVLNFFGQVKSYFEAAGANAKTCKYVKSWYGQAGMAIGGIALTVFSGGTIAIGGLVAGATIGMLISVLTSYTMPMLIQFAAGVVAPDPAGPGGGYVIGEGIASGLGGMSTELGKNGMRPTMKSDAAAVASDANKQMAEMKLIENSGQSPFSMDSPNSISSRLALALTPYIAAPTASANYQNLASLAIAPISIFGSSFNKLFLQKANAASASSGYGGEYCVDSDLTQLGYLVDADCNVIMSNTVVDDPAYTPEKVYDYMINNGHVENSDGSPKSEAYKKYNASCVDYTGPALPDGSDAEGTSDIDTRLCPKTDTQETMFMMYNLYQNTSDAMAKSAEDTLGKRPAGSGTSTGGGNSSGGSNLDVAACKGTIPAGDNVKILCESLKYDNYGYLWGGGHASAAAFVNKFKSGYYKAGSDSILDCSGLVHIAVYEAFGEDISLNVEGITSNSSHYAKIAINEAKPGDLITRLGGIGNHVMIVYANHPENNSLEIFHAATSKAAFPNQITHNDRTYNELNAAGKIQAYRYVGPKHDQ